MTTQETYTIKDAAKKVRVEAHVLRYWEEELKLPIARNELGHRFYTEKDVELLGRVRDWKQQGLQLKAIRLMLSEDGRLAVPQEVVKQAQSMVEAAAQPAVEGQPVTAAQAAEETAGQMAENEAVGMQNAVTANPSSFMKPFPSIEAILLDERCTKAAKLQLLLENLVSRTVQESNEAILKELDFQFRQMEENAQEREKKRMEREEERYRKLDELICQRGRRKKGRRRGM